MSMYPQELMYCKDHTWVKIEGDVARIGITHYAQQQLRDIVFANIFEDNDSIVANEPLGSLESVKSVSDVIAPVSGTIVEINEKILDNPETINQDPYGEGYIMLVKVTDMSQLSTLMNACQYQESIQ